jgi:hypothetical protein
VTDEAVLGRIHYHHAAHECWADRQLHFWFLTAHSFYERDAFKRELKAVANELGIETYATYELIGSYDLMIRLYLKSGSGTKDFAAAVRRRLRPATQYRFGVEEVARHWVWAKGSDDRGPIHEPSAEILSRRYPRTELALLNDQENGSAERTTLIERYAALDLVRTVVPGDGIKVVITVGFDHSPDEEDLARFRDRLCKWLDKSKERLHERSLYVGDAGQKQQFLVMCLIAHRDFHRIREWLIEPIADAVGTGHTHATTYPVASSDLVCFEERIELPSENRADVTSLMSSHELSRFEVKASLLAPLDPWLKSDKPLSEQPAWPLKSVLKGIVGLLNSGGGTMVIGAAEEQAYEKFQQALARLRQFPALGPYRVVGLVDPTYTEFGWDAWDTKFNNLLQAKIDPPPGVLVQRREGELEGQPVCVVDVDEPQEDAAFWLREAQNSLVYYARVGTSVTPLHGTAADQHRENMRHHRQERRRNHSG